MSIKCLGSDFFDQPSTHVVIWKNHVAKHLDSFNKIDYAAQGIAVPFFNSLVRLLWIFWKISDQDV